MYVTEFSIILEKIWPPGHLNQTGHFENIIHTLLLSFNDDCQSRTATTLNRLLDEVLLSN